MVVMWLSYVNVVNESLLSHVTSPAVDKLSGEEKSRKSQSPLRVPICIISFGIGDINFQKSQPFTIPDISAFSGYSVCISYKNYCLKGRRRKKRNTNYCIRLEGHMSGWFIY